MTIFAEQATKSLYTVAVISTAACFALSAQALADVETTILDGLGNQEVMARDINNKTQIVGSAIDSISGLRHAILWEDGGVLDLGTLGGPCSSASAIDEGGVHIAGSADVSSAFFCNGQPHAFLWRQGEMVDLGTLGGSTSSASDVNKNGVVVGNSATSDFVEGPFGPEPVQRGFRWHRGAMEELGTLGGTNSFANALNNHGVIVGASDTGDMRTVVLPFPPFEVDEPVLHAVVWMDGTAHDIHPPGWDGNSTAVAIVESGEIIVVAFPTDPGPQQVFSYRNGNHNALSAEGVSGFNQKGQLLASAFDPVAGLVARVIGKKKSIDLPNPLVVAFGGGPGGSSLAGLNNRHQAIGNAFRFTFIPPFTFLFEDRAVLYDFTPGN